MAWTKEKAKAYQRLWRQRNPEKNRDASRKWRAKNPERNRDINTAYNKIWRVKNREKTRASSKKWAAKNPNWQQKWRAGHKEQVRMYRQKWKKYKRDTDPNWKITENMRSSMSCALSGKQKSASTMKIIGCTAAGLYQHLESCSTWEPWMTRENYGKGGWDVDHIIAIKHWDYTCPLQFIFCWVKINLQPMEHIANIKKGVK